MGDFWRTSGRARLQTRAAAKQHTTRSRRSAAEQRAAIVRADVLYEPPPAPSSDKNHPKRPRKVSEGWCDEMATQQNEFASTRFF